MSSKSRSHPAKRARELHSLAMFPPNIPFYKRLGWHPYGTKAQRDHMKESGLAREQICSGISADAMTALTAAMFLANRFGVQTASRH